MLRGWLLPRPGRLIGILFRAFFLCGVRLRMRSRGQMMMSMRKRPRPSGWSGCRQRRDCLRLSRLFDCCCDCYFCSVGLRRGCFDRGQMCRPLFGGVRMLRGSGCRWDSHLGCSCLGCSRHHLDAICEDLHGVILGLVLLKRLHQLLLSLCGRVRPACPDGDEAGNVTERIPSRSRMGHYYERL